MADRQARERQRQALGERLRDARDAEALLAAGADELHAALTAVCDELSAGLTPARARSPVRVARWAYSLWVWFGGQPILTLDYEAIRDPDLPGVLARCRARGDSADPPATLTLVRTGPASAEWRSGLQTPVLREFCLGLLDRAVDERFGRDGQS